jgi:hypothetical protein
MTAGQRRGNRKNPLDPSEPDLRRTRRWLPHWQQGGSVYFVTFRTLALDLGVELRRLVLDACRFFDGQRYHLLAAVVMPDHVHLLLWRREGGRSGEFNELT